MWGQLSKGSEKRKEVETTSKQGGLGNDNKRAKVGKGFLAAAPHRNEYVALIQNNKGKARGRAFNVNAVDALQDPKVMTGYGSFDVIMGMDWLSKHKAEIVCHEKGG
ncbi:hypothetical protein Tco_0441961 [Tanacetum coccineum]